MGLADPRDSETATQHRCCLRDGKASNIVIDKEQNAWLIDFGGGWTEGWVDEELADSVEGDNQAVVRISEFLGV